MSTLAAAPAVRAQSAADKAAAEALFDEGKRLREAKRYAEACPKFADSQKLDPAVGTLLNLALCYKENGQTASAWSTYREAAAQASAAKQPEREQLARDEAAALETKLTRLVIEVHPSVASTSGIEVKRDGATVPQGLWGVAAPVDPGVRIIEVTAPGKKPLRLEARAEGAGATAKVVINALEDDTAATPAPVPATSPPLAEPAAEPAPPPADTGSKPGSTQRLLGYGAIGLGVVGLGVGTFYTFQSRAHNSDALSICEDPDDACTEDDVDDHDLAVKKARAAQLNSFVAFGLGGVGVITGVVLIVTAPKGESKAARVRVLPDVSDGHAGLRLSGVW